MRSKVHFLFLLLLSSTQFAYATCTDFLHVALQKNQHNLESNNFNIGRTLQSYYYLFQNLDKTIAELKPNSRWFDGGSGKSHFFYDYYISYSHGRSPKLELIATGISKPKDSKFIDVLELQNKLTFKNMYGQKLEDLDTNGFQKVDIITDSYAALSYSDRPDLVLQKYLEILNTGGKLFTFLHGTVNGSNPASPLFYFIDSLIIKNKNGKFLSTIEWLDSIKGIKRINQIIPSEVQKDNIVRLTFERTAEEIEIPEIELIHFSEGPPPLRTYQMKN